MRTRLLTLCLCAASLCAQGSLRDTVMTMYQNFDTATGSRAQVDQLIRLRDYWEQAYKTPGPYVPLLRAELALARQPDLFYVDGSTRLLHLSDTIEDRRLALRALTRTDVSKVGPVPYYALVSRLAQLNEDTSRAAFHLLEWPDMQMRVAGNIWGLDRIVARLVVPTDVKYWGDAAIERLETEPNELAQQVLLLIVWYAQSDFGDDELRAFSDDPKMPRSSREFAQRLRAQKPNAEERLDAEAGTLAELRAAQRDAALRMNVPDLWSRTRALTAYRQAHPE